MSTQRIWHNLSVNEVIESLNSSIQGLTKEEAERRLARFGPNELAEKKKVSPFMLWLGQFKDFLIIILLVAVVLSAILGEVTDAIVIFVIVLFATTLGFIQEYRAERVMEALKRMAAPTSSVLRDGQEIEIPAREIVPGDIVVLRTGDKIPADCRLIEAVNLKTEEAPLTGESVPLEKTVDAIPGEVSIGDRKNMAFMGTTVVWGRGKAIVTGTGMQTEFGKIATMIQEVGEELTPLQVNLNKMGRFIAYAALVLCFVLAGIGILRGHEILEMLIWGVSLAIAAVPEALPAVVTIGLALGVRQMAKRHALIRRLHAAETLGCTTVICSDKTGTLTQDEMTVRRIYVDGKTIDVTGVGYEPKGEFHLNGKAIDVSKDIALQKLFQICALCNDTSLASTDGVWRIRGDPTEGALVVLSAKAGLSAQELNARFPRIDEIPFSSERKRMTTIHSTPEGKIACSKGAPEIILDSSSHILKDGRESPLTEKDKAGVLSIAMQMAGDALRVLGLAYKRLTGLPVPKEDSETEMVFVGLVGMIDPPRKEVKDAVKLCDQAGIKSVMITGDHKLTAVAIAKELGILKERGMALTGAEVDKLSDEEFEALVDKIDVYARVSPAHKMRVIDALAKQGNVVAMTGDGINDAPALKRSDIGVAMGITGTDVTKETADMVLTDDNFASIVAAVEEGRHIFSNIKKYLVYLLSCNLGEILLMAVAILFGTAFGLAPGVIPLVAVQILYVNLATDGLPAIALSVDPPDLDTMKQKPRPRNQTIFTKDVNLYLVLTGIWTCVATFGVFVWAVNSGKTFAEAQTLCFVSLILIEFFNAFNCRSFKYSLFKIGPASNKWLLAAIGWELCLLNLIVYLPVLQGPFQTYPLSAQDWGICILAGASIFILVEIVKLTRARLARPSLEMSESA
ncbi:MAG: calcium-translocating P-type ATPase, SERCA-type [Chloroflexi bacterium]|nr:calcium-translocating P-type ATPase, SERCA-type [Chloroflexota bacterium]